MQTLPLLLVLALMRGQDAAMTAERADTIFQSQDWPAAVTAYEELIKKSGPTAQFHMRLGVALTQLGRTDEAIAHLQSAEKVGAPQPAVAMRLALAHSRAGNRDLAFRELMKTTDYGLATVPAPIEADPDYARLRADPRYREFISALDKNARPCEYDAKHRELDFGIGEWEVRAANAPSTIPAATNIITKAHNGCVIVESYSATGVSGQSVNIYDRSHGKWHQTWVDSSGGLHEYWGELEDGNMIYEGSLPPTRGQKNRQQTRMTFFNLGPDKLRQLSEVTLDGGKTWQLNYDLLYTRRK